jgi:hypothetical protein
MLLETIFVIVGIIFFAILLLISLLAVYISKEKFIAGILLFISSLFVTVGTIYIIIRFIKYIWSL